AHRHRRHTVAVILATLLVPLAAASASAASSKPTVTVATTVAGTSVSVSVDDTRAPKPIASCVDRDDGARALPCGDSDATGRKGTTYRIDLSDQMTGDHSIRVSVGLTDGGGDSDSASFTISGGVVLAIAWTDVDGNHTYESAVDTLIAELVDSDEDGVASTGDTVIADRYPLNADASRFGAFLLKSETVTSVEDVGFGVNVTIPSGVISWQHFSTVEGLQFAAGNGSGNPVLLDGTNSDLDCTGDASDAVIVEVGGTLHPDTNAEDFVCDHADNRFIDVLVH
ncbi:MAG: hypothetical protein ACJ78H_12680, partial [Chloroflexota bacterium]